RLVAEKNADMTPGDLPDSALVDKALAYLNLARNELVDSGEDIVETIKEAFNKLDVATFGYKADEFIDLFLNITAVDKHWLYLMSCLRLGSRYDLLQRVIKGPEPTRGDWENIFKPVKYEFGKSWRFRIFAFMFVTATIVSIVKLLGTIPYPNRSMYVPVFLGGLGLLIWDIVLIRSLIKGLSQTGFERLGFLLIASLIGPAFLIITLVNDMIRHVRGKKPSATSVGTLLIFFSVFSAICSILTLPLVILAYFTTSAMLPVLAWKYIIILWLLFVGVMVTLWLTGSRLHRAAQNPLSKILELDMSSKTNIQPRGILRLLSKIIR
ncbi:MAG: hypothetical protein ACREA2_19775, partial [Blastocatellia bacterium]